MKRFLATIVVALTLTALSAGSVLAVGGPNEAGNSGWFKPNSNPCQGQSDQPNCPGPQH